MSNKINMNTLLKIVTVFIFIHLSGYMHAQKICPDESVKVDKKKIKQCKKTENKFGF